MEIDDILLSQLQVVIVITHFLNLKLTGMISRLFPIFHFLFINFFS